MYFLPSICARAGRVRDDGFTTDIAVNHYRRNIPTLPCPGLEKRLPDGRCPPPPWARTNATRRYMFQVPCRLPDHYDTWKDDVHYCSPICKWPLRLGNDMVTCRLEWDIENSDELVDSAESATITCGKIDMYSKFARGKHFCSMTCKRPFQLAKDMITCRLEEEEKTRVKLAGEDEWDLLTCPEEDMFDKWVDGEHFCSPSCNPPFELAEDMMNCIQLDEELPVGWVLENYCKKGWEQNWKGNIEDCLLPRCDKRQYRDAIGACHWPDHIKAIPYMPDGGRHRHGG